MRDIALFYLLLLVTYFAMLYLRSYLMDRMLYLIRSQFRVNDSIADEFDNVYEDIDDIKMRLKMK